MAGLISRITDAVVEKISSRLESEILEKAVSEDKERKSPVDGPADELSGLLVDPFALLDTMGYRDRYSAVSYQVLEQMAFHVPIFPSIIQTRRAQLSNFCEQETDLQLPGFCVMLRDPKGKPSKKQQIEMQGLSEMIENTGWSQSLVRDDFETYVRKIVFDAYTYDQACTEIVRNKQGVPCDFYALDGASIRIADTAWKNDPTDDQSVRYVQVHDESVVAEFTAEQLCFGVRNPRSDLRVNGYGMSELEIGLAICTAMMNGFNYNAKFFQSGHVAKGMLNVPKVPDAKLRLFSRQWHMLVSGVINAWRTPITNFDDVKWIDLQKSNRDMEWAEFINFLFKLFSGICLIDPNELNFQFGNTGQSQQMFGSPVEDKIKSSRDKGLRPLLKNVARWLNRYFVQKINPDYRLLFTGLDPREGDKITDIEKKQVTYLKTVNELRTENDLPALPPEQGDLILDPNWMQAYQAEKAMQQQQEMGYGGEEGDQMMEGQEGDQEPGQEVPGPEAPQEAPQEGEGESPNWRWSSAIRGSLGKSDDADDGLVKYEIDI